MTLLACRMGVRAQTVGQGLINFFRPLGKSSVVQYLSQSFWTSCTTRASEWVSYIDFVGTFGFPSMCFY